MNVKFDYPLFADCGAPSLYNKLSRNVEFKGVLPSQGMIVKELIGEAPESAIKYDLFGNPIKEKSQVSHGGPMGATLKDRKFDDYSYTESEDYKKYRERYIQFLLVNQDKITTYSNLDVINNPKLTLENQRILESYGLHPIPVFHLGNDPIWLERYIKKYPYIAIGGLIPNTTKQLYHWLDDLFTDHICDSDGVPKVKTHGFACTSVALMTRYPWATVDSATCRKLGMFGWLTWVEHSYPYKLITFKASTRDIDAQFRFFRKEEKKCFERKAEQFGTSLQEFSEDGLKRVIWNYTVFAERIQQTVPMWPWVFNKNKTDESKYPKKAVPNADEFLTFYFAGILSKREEVQFWKEVMIQDVERVKGRLQSFFYTPALENAIGLKL